MARSTETFSKKEKQKAEDRKANAGKGKSLEDMMAYIDEYGNITSIPPDLSRKIKVNIEDIQIKDLQTQKSIFVHANALTERLKENNAVTFETE